MAESTSWRKHLNNHHIFQYLSENIEPSAKNRDLLAVKDGELYLWVSRESQLLTTNLKTLIKSGDNEGSSQAFQRLLCNNAPMFEVDRMLFNQTGSHVALVGRDGVSVLEIPQRWGRHAEFQGGKERVICTMIPVAERYFRTSGEKLLHAAWHPGSQTDSHLVLLTSDNSIRIYSLQDPQNPARTILLKDNNPDLTRSPGKLNVDQALGEVAVSFDFGLPVPLLPRRRQSLGGSRSVELEENTVFAWPLYIMWGNGNVYSILTTVDLKFQLNSQLRGPLTMYPPAEDNYGTDACSILCLQSRPPVLVVATCEGKLYHCVVLNRGEEDQVKVKVEGDTENLQVFQPIPETMLYVYESVEIEFSLTTVALETDMPLLDDYNCPITLHPDSGCLDRYHCSHMAGVHTVALPWAQKLQDFCDNEPNLPTLGSSHQAIVEHLVCTKPSATSSAAPILGLCVTADRLLGATLLCLTSACQCLSFPLVEHYRTMSSDLLSTEPMREMKSPLRNLRRETFDNHIRRILQRSSSAPLLKQAAGRTVSSPKECFQLLSRYTQVFREEYIQKQDLAREEIQKRVRHLKEHKQQQQFDLQDVQQAKNILTEGAHNLAENYETAKDRHSQLVDRIETVLKKLQSRLPMVSDAERNMQRELLNMEEHIKVFRASVTQLKVKQDYQRRQVKPQGSSRTSSPAFSKAQSGHLRSLLKQEGDEIGDLVQQINHLKVNLET